MIWSDIHCTGTKADVHKFAWRTWDVPRTCQSKKQPRRRAGSQMLDEDTWDVAVPLECWCWLPALLRGANCGRREKNNTRGNRWAWCNQWLRWDVSFVWCGALCVVVRHDMPLVAKCENLRWMPCDTVGTRAVYSLHGRFPLGVCVCKQMLYSSIKTHESHP